MLPGPRRVAEPVDSRSSVAGAERSHMAAALADSRSRKAAVDFHMHMAPAAVGSHKLIDRIKT